MVAREIGWPDYGLPKQEDDLEACREGPIHVEECRIEVTGLPEPGPVIEVRDLLCRLYGRPDEVGARNPYVAVYKRLRGCALQQSGDSKAHNYVIGIVDYGYWPSLTLGYIEYSLAVNPEGFGLLERAGLVPEPPENSECLWRRWFSTT